MKFFRRSRQGTGSKPAPGKQAMPFIMPKGVSWTVDDIMELEVGGRFREALERWQILLAPFQDPQVAPRLAKLESHRYIWLHVGMCYRHLEMYDEALDAYGTAAALARQATDARYVAEVSNNIGVVYRNRGELDAALREFQGALEAAETVRDVTLVAAVHDNIAMCYRMQGHLDRALTEEERAYSLFASNPSHVGARVQSRVLGNLGLLHLDLGQRRKAVPILEQALAKARDAGDHVQEAAIVSNLGQAKG